MQISQALASLPSAIVRCMLPDRPSAGDYTAAYVEIRLEEAGRCILALPGAGCFPVGFRSAWPETGGSDPRRYPLPSNREISDMDEAYRWTSWISSVDQRRIVLMRSLVRPDSDEAEPRYVWSWRRLQRVTGLHRDTLIMRWGRGVDTIVTRLNARPEMGQGRPTRAA